MMLEACVAVCDLFTLLWIWGGKHSSLGEGNGNPLQYFCLENPMGGGAWWAAVHGVVKSRTQLSNFTVTFHFHELEKEMATHFSVLAWRIPGTGEPGGLPSMGLHRVRHDWSDLEAAAAAAFLTKSENEQDPPGQRKTTVQWGNRVLAPQGMCTTRSSTPLLTINCHWPSTATRIKSCASDLQHTLKV